MACAYKIDDEYKYHAIFQIAFATLSLNYRFTFRNAIIQPLSRSDTISHNFANTV